MQEIGHRPQRKRSVIKIIFLTVLIFVITVLVIKFFKLEKEIIRGPQSVVSLITDTGLESDRDRVNVLLLGTGGQGHEGPDLSDTMILASIDKEGRDVLLISIPRDLWAPPLSAKVNTAYAFGQEKKDQGLTLAKETTGKLFDLPIHYTVRLDFDGFIRAVNLVKGLEIDIENSFVDNRYPIKAKEDDLCGLIIETQEIEGASQEVVKDATGSAIPLAQINDLNNPFICRYEIISFQKGLTLMDGLTALKFVRSRHGTAGEGSDFARSSRQQKVLLAFRQKVLSVETLTNPKTALDLAKTFGQSIDTDIESDEVPHFIKLIQKIDTTNIRRLVLDQGRPESALEVGDSNEYGGQFALVPRNGNWHDLAEYVQGEIFNIPTQ